MTNSAKNISLFNEVRCQFNRQRGNEKSQLCHGINVIMIMFPNDIS